MSDDQIIAYSGEMMLAGWTESHNGGRKVTFWLSDDSAEHPFKRFTSRAGKVAGQRFMVAFVQLDDNEQPVDQEAAQKAAGAAKQASAHRQPSAPKESTSGPEKGGELAKWAGILCNDPVFWEWARLTHPETWSSAWDHATEKDGGWAIFIRHFCGIRSRRELDHNAEAGRKFREEIMKPFHKWRETGDA
jgi:hypothetical protein